MRREVRIGANSRWITLVWSGVGLMRGVAGHAHHHQSFALGIGADALGELYRLPDQLPDALRSGARLRM